MPLNRNLPPVRADQFSMVPRGDVPRSTFSTQHALKTTFQSGYLIPIHVDEVLPGDVHDGDLVVFARLATPLFPIMDEITVETFFFFVPARLVWTNWVKMMGERKSPSDSISFTIPQLVSPAGGYAVCSIYDYFGLPTVGQVTAGQTVSHNVLPLRAYNLIWNEWYRDENLQTPVDVDTDDGPDSTTQYALKRRNKKHDYFTSCLPWPTKNNDIPAIGLSGLAPVMGISVHNTVAWTAGNPAGEVDYTGGAPNPAWAGHYDASSGNVSVRLQGLSGDHYPKVEIDGSAFSLQLNAIRLAVATQQLLERDARGGTRYVELLQSHFGVFPEDQRLQRPEYIGGGRSSMQTSAIPQTAPASGGSTPLGAVGAAATVADRHEFSYHATEHGYIIGLAHVTGAVTYQHGLHRMWTRQTRYDIYWPAFAFLGEQAVREDELYCTGTDSVDTGVFGYQERWAEYRHRPSRITGLFKTKSASNIDEWHLSQDFASAPTLSSTFIEDNPPFSRVLAAGALADNQQILWDSVFNIRCTRALPVRSVPGLERF